MIERLIPVTVELIAGFFGLLLSLKITGKRQVSQISPFDFVSAVVLGEIVGNAVYDADTHVFYLLYAITLWTTLIFSLEKLTEKFRKTRKLIVGSPQIVIKDGIVDFKLLKRENLDFDELVSLLRDKGVFSLREVEYAIVEIGGNLSVKKKDKYDSPTKDDLKLKINTGSSLNLPVVLDGEIVEENLILLDLTKSEVLNEIYSRGITNIKDVMYGEYSKLNGYYFQKRN